MGTQSLISKVNVDERHRDSRELEKETDTQRQQEGKSEIQREKGRKKVKRGKQSDIRRWGKEIEN